MIPARPKVFHITHGANLAGIAQAGLLFSDQHRIATQLPTQLVGLSNIKQRRLTLPVHCNPGTCVGDYVPFYFCPRSVMLYILHKGNHAELGYQGGQRPMLHLQADMHAAVDWAEQHGAQWAFSDCNAAIYVAQFFNQLNQLSAIDWAAVHATRWTQVKEGKQAEFLVHDRFPWSLIEKIGVMDEPLARRVRELLDGATHQPAVVVEPGWYY